MNRPSLYRTMRKTPEWAPYARDVFLFLDYLRRTEDLVIRAHGEKQAEGGLDYVTCDIPYVHRWTKKYRRGVMKKFYQLEEYMQENPLPVTMITLTSYHGYNRFHQKSDESDLTIEQTFEALKGGWQKFRKMAQNMGLSYVWVMEPHENGYPHYHVIAFRTFTEKEKAHLTTLWADRYGIGSEENGIKFTEPPIKSIRNYLVKYLSKTLKDTGSKFTKNEWSLGHLVFNALVKKHQWRVFGATKNLSKVMAYAKNTYAETTYYATELQNKNGAGRPLWLKREKTGWGEHTRVYRPLENNVTVDERLLDQGMGINSITPSNIKEE